MTLTVIQTTDNKEFGGFTDIDFENKGLEKNANGYTFLFTIEMDKSVKMHKYKGGNWHNEIECHPSLWTNTLDGVNSDSNLNYESFVEIGETFEIINDIKYLDGGPKEFFQVTELEVF